MQEHNQRNKSRQRHRLHRNRILLVMDCLLATAVVVGGIAVFGFPVPVQAWTNIQPDRHAISGSLHNRESREIDKDNFWVALSQLPTTSEGSRECNIEYENLDSNHYGAQVSLYLTESGWLLDSIRRVGPGNYVEVIQMNQTLEVGEYPPVVRIELLGETIPPGTITLKMALRTARP